MGKCPKCNKPLKKNDVFCSKCGYKIKPSKDEEIAEKELKRLLILDNEAGNIGKEYGEINKRLNEDDFKDTSEVVPLIEISTNKAGKFVKMADEELKDIESNLNMIKNKELKNKSLKAFEAKKLGFEMFRESFEHLVGNKWNEEPIELTKGTYRIVCPYCKNNNVLIGVKKTHDEYECPSCNRLFLSIIGKVRAVRGLGGQTSHTVTIRLKNMEGGESVINYFSDWQGIEMRAGDVIAITYKKGILGNYGPKPSYILNYSTSIYNDKL